MKAIIFKKLVKDENAKKINLKKFLSETDYFNDMEDFNDDSYGKSYNMNGRNSIFVKEWNELDKDIYDLDGYLLHEIRDNSVEF